MSIYPTNQLQRLDPLPNLLAQQVLPTSERVLFQARARTRIDSIFLAALTNNNSDYSLWHKRQSSDASASPTNAEALFKSVQMSGKTAVQHDVPIYLADGDAIWCSCSASDHITATLYGSELDG